MDWFRFYNDARSDNKLKLLTDSEFRVWVNLLCLASEQTEQARGTIDGTDRFVLAAEVAHADETLLVETLAKLVKLRMISDDHDVIRFAKWDKRQPHNETPLWMVRRKGWMLVRRQLSPLVFQRDGYRCRLCGATNDLQVDHILALAHGGSNHIENLQTLCKRCNNTKGPHGRSARQS